MMGKYVIRPVVSLNRHNSFVELCYETEVTVGQSTKLPRYRRRGLFNPHYEIGYLISDAGSKVVYTTLSEWAMQATTYVLQPESGSNHPTPWEHPARPTPKQPTL